MLKAWQELQRIRNDNAALAELPIATLAALTANINRDPKKGKAFTALDFCLFHREQKESGPLKPEVAAVALALRAEGKLPPLIVACWSQVMASIADGTPAPAVRALKDASGSVWVLAPSWEGRNVRGGLVAVRGQLTGPITLSDLDRPLLRYRLVLPERKGAGWLEAGLLLLAES